MNFGTSEKNGDNTQQNPSKRLSENIPRGYLPQTPNKTQSYPTGSEIQDPNARGKIEKSKANGGGAKGKRGEYPTSGSQIEIGYEKVAYGGKAGPPGHRSRLKMPFLDNKNEIVSKGLNDYPPHKAVGDGPRYATDKRLAQTIDVSKNDRRAKDNSHRLNERAASNSYNNSIRSDVSPHEKSRKFSIRKTYNARDKKASYNMKINGRAALGKGGPILEFNNTSGRKTGPSQQLFGDFRYGDRPKQILKARKLEGLIEFIVEWEEREGGFKPKNSVITNQELKENDIEFLVNFYEGRVIFPDEFMSKRPYRGNRNSAGSRAPSYQSSHKKMMGSGMKNPNFC